ncbi:MAG: sugar phosphate isomerase/epimerase family protein [Candidatus Bathyarchaeia archaeon]
MDLGSTALVFSKLTFEESLGKLRALGLDGFELYHPFFYKSIFQGTLSLEPKGLKDVMVLVEAYGLKVLSVNAGNNFVQPDMKLFQEQVEGVKACVDVAAEIGCPVVRVFGGEFAEGKTEAQCIGAITEGLRQSAAHAEERGVTLALENHGRITNNIDTLMGILKEVGSESLKVNLDTGNFYWFGYKLSEVEAIFEKLAPMTAHTHMKNGTTPRREERRKPGEVKLVPLPEGDIDLAKIVKLLKAKGYKGAISMEDEFEGWTSLPIEKVMETLKKDADYLRAAM